MTPLHPQLPKGASLATAAQIARLAGLLSRYRNVTVLTGAGISTESGLSDYRSPGKRKPVRTPINHNHYVTSPALRQRYWARSFVGYPILSSAKPGLAHFALSALHDRAGARFRSHITQNVDGLLQRAGLPTARLVELHGSIHALVCRQCATIESRHLFQTRLVNLNAEWSAQLRQYEYRPDGDADLDLSLVSRFSVPRCASCGADALMPTVVFHGGQVPRRDTDTASLFLHQSDALLIIGSTVTPFSAYRLAKIAKDEGKFVGCINFGPTRADDIIDFKVEALVGDAVARLADQILVGGFAPPDSMAASDQSANNASGGKLQL